MSVAVDSFDRLVVVGFGTYETRDGDYYTKQPVVEYLHKISQCFNDVVALGHEAQSDRYSTCIDQSRVTPKLTGYSTNTNGLASAIKLLRSNLELLNLAQGNTAVLLNIPLIFYAPVTPLLPTVSNHLSTYFAANPDDVASLQRSRGSVSDNLKALLTEAQSTFLSKFSDSLLLRGNLDQYGGNTYTVQSKPIVSLPERDQVDARNETSTTLLYVGGLYERKGIEYLLDAFKELRLMRDSELQLRIIGDGEASESLQQQVQAHSISDAVTFTGWIDDIHTLAREYKTSDVFVLPSVTAEGSPRCIDEAQYYGTPVIATNLGYYEESLQDEENILFVEAESSETIRQAIERLLDDATLRERLQRAGQQRMDKKLERTAAEQHAALITSPESFRD